MPPRRIVRPCHEGRKHGKSLDLKQPTLGRCGRFGGGIAEDPGCADGFEERPIPLPRIPHRWPEGQGLQGDGGLGRGQTPGEHLRREAAKPGSGAGEGQKPRLTMM